MTQGQDWQTPILLSGRAGSQIVVDSLLRLHVFGVQSRSPHGGQPNTMYYYRYDNWGRPIADPVELVPDTHWTDYPGYSALIDHLDRIHVVWYRDFSDPNVVQLVYVRLSNEGEFLQEPYIYEVPGDQPGGIQVATYHLVETVTGEIWAACGGHYFAFDINGNLIEPVQRVYPYPEDGHIRIAAAPDGSVWGTCRKEDSNLDTLKTIRLWPPPRIEETTLISSSPGFGPQAFAIDQYGSFHYVIYTDENALFYRFDPRGMGPIIETVIDPSPYGVGISNLLPIGQDSLQFMWGQTLPPPHGVNRVCFTLDGNVGFGPMLIPQQNFGISDYSGMWRDSGYWILGHVWGEDNGPAMLHIPGPNEPLAVNERPNELANTYSLTLFPNPFNSTLSVSLTIPAHQETTIALYDLLGREVDVIYRGRLASSTISYRAAAGLASGIYFVRAEAGGRAEMRKVVLLK